MNAPDRIDKIIEIPIAGTPYRVVDEDGWRQLMVMGNDASMHCEMLIRAPDVMASRYARLMMNALPFPPRLDDILLIGLGGGQQTKFLYRYLPGTRLVTVEIDAAVVDISRTYFMVPPDDERLTVVVDDGGRHVAAHPLCCDVLLCDGYDHTFNVPDSLAGEEFYRACERALRPGGVMALNLDRRSDAWRAAHLRLLRRIFDSHLELPVNENQSILLLFKRDREQDYPALLRRAKRLDELLDLDLASFIGSLEHRR
ncbi:methyltransferase domain-containing protein [Pseudoduganella namucuonensis]|uniref:Spermidine synthase n=1 Tax=Pseudoduganella namucuonensis TaxID=1035707 RepID=A0A1I7M6F2_9BURK|nr:methyltransferase domain-containing protein [Pseudoduganella namucuonensis]SFV17506.1 spermidine synthase [Pseudoduganella namucuonensis]